MENIKDLKIIKQGNGHIFNGLIKKDDYIYVDILLIAKAKGFITHAEHDAIGVDSETEGGEYVFCQQMEFDPISNIIRTVID